MKRLLLITSLIMLSLTGCKEKQEEFAEIIAEEYETIQETEEISYVPEEYTIPTSSKELYELSLEEFKEVVLYNIPNYREFFKIDEDYVLTDADWEVLREILSLHLFGEVYYEDIETEIEIEAIDENAIYYSATKEFFENLDEQGMIEYLTGLYKYLNPNGEVVDFSKLTSEQLEELRQDFINDFE